MSAPRRILIEELSRARPGYCFPGRGMGRSRRAGQIPPLHHRSDRRHDEFPARHSASSPFPSRLEREGQLVSAVVYNPVDRRNVRRRKGPWRLSERQAPARRGAQEIDARGLVRHRAPSWAARDHRTFLAELKAGMASTPGIRRCGAAASTSPAWRRAATTAIWERGLNALGHGGRHPAGARGGRHRHRPGRAARGRSRTGESLASNEALHPQILKLLKDAGSAARG